MGVIPLARSPCTGLLRHVLTVHYHVLMQTVRMESKGIRLHPKLWERIEREARSLRLKPSDYLRRKIEDAFIFDSEVQNMPTRETIAHDTGLEVL